MAMPWSLAKAKAAVIRSDETGAAHKRLTALFDTYFRIQREACEAAGRFIPMVIENVRGAQPWVGRAAWNYGSYYLWGDVPALMPPTVRAIKVPGFRFDGNGGSFQTASVNAHIKNDGGSWFNVGSPGQKVTGKNPVHQLAGVKGSEGYERDHPAAFGWKKPGTSSQSKARKAASAKIAKIPEILSRHIGRTYFPRDLA